MFFTCHLGWMNRRRFCLQKGGSQEHISLITIMFCLNEFAFTVQALHKRARGVDQWATGGTPRHARLPRSP